MTDLQSALDALSEALAKVDASELPSEWAGAVDDLIMAVRGHLTVADPAAIAGEVTQSAREAAEKLCYPHTHTCFDCLDELTQAIADAEARGRAAERADVVRWLRLKWGNRHLVYAIEGGEHLAKESGQ